MVFDLPPRRIKNSPAFAPVLSRPEPVGDPIHKENALPANYVARPDETRRRLYAGAHSDPIFDEAEAPVPGLSTMLNVFFGEEYPEPGLHDDHEGFFVVGGRGKMMLDGVEYELAPGSAMVAPAGVRHAIRKVGEEDLRVFIYHFPK